MRWKKKLYFTHRWLALIVGLQLLAWSVGGFMFSILDIDNVRGDLDRNKRPPPPIIIEDVKLSPAEAIAAAVAAVAEGDFAPGDVTRISLGRRLGGLGYDLLDADGLPLASVDATSGAVTIRITEEQAARAAVSDFMPEAGVRSVAFLEGEPPGEFRGNPMPVYQVVLDHPKNPHIYVSPVTGEVLKHRNRRWRIFDFFWMLHIMDYSGRTDFGHWLLTGMSVLAILTSASGLILWTFRIPRRRASAVFESMRP